MNGSDTTTGGSIIMPIDISTEATTRSMIRNGKNSLQPQVELWPPTDVAQQMEENMETILIIVLIVLLLGGGGWYGRGRWYGRRPL